MSKFIGETEETWPPCLIRPRIRTDSSSYEADAIFGKRTSVLDPQHKYTNQEVTQAGIPQGILREMEKEGK